jgi:hypothetical protein
VRQNAKLVASRFLSRFFVAVDAGASAYVRPTKSRPCAEVISEAMVVSVSSFMARDQRNLEWADQARGTAIASIAFPQRLRLLFSPAAEVRHSSREAKKAGCSRPSLALRA